MRARLLRPGMQVASAGLAAMRGFPIDPKAQAVLAAHGYDGSGHIARQATKPLMLQSDLVLAMDEEVYGRLSGLAPSTSAGRLRLFLEFAPELGRRDVPDPYYGGAAGFEEVLDLVEAGARGLLAALAGRD